MSIYTAGAFKSYDEALALKNEIVGNGIPDAFIVAYAGDRQITIQAAQEALKGQ